MNMPFQTFDEQATRRNAQPVLRPCAPNWPSRGLTVSDPRSDEHRANMCPSAPSG